MLLVASLLVMGVTSLVLVVLDQKGQTSLGGWPTLLAMAASIFGTLMALTGDYRSGYQVGITAVVVLIEGMMIFEISRLLRRRLRRPPRRYGSRI
jgi:hypothetical protein